MKLGIFSDTHLGFDSKGQRYKEAFENLKQSLELCVQEKADLIVLPGDVFHEPVPSHTSIFEAMNCFSLAKKGGSEVNLFLEKNNETKKLNYKGVPILTIHGNHEYRGKEFKTALDILDLAGLINYFHAGKITIEKEGERICVFGLGAVPEKKALEALQYWNPKPEEGQCNILLLHQGFVDFMAIDDEMIATLSLSDLPKGFELIINGHLHWNNQQKIGETTFLLPGSTIATSIKKLESEKPKGVHFYDTKTKELGFKSLPNQRKMFHNKITLNNANLEEVFDECKKILDECLIENHELKPLIRINMKGTLAKGLSPGDVNLNEIYDKYSDKAILSLSKNFSSNSFKKKISELRETQKSRRSVASLGFELLEKNLEETDFGTDFEVKKLFDLLAENNLDSAMELVMKKRE